MKAYHLNTKVPMAMIVNRLVVLWREEFDMDISVFWEMKEEEIERLRAVRSKTREELVMGARTARTALVVGGWQAGGRIWIARDYSYYYKIYLL